MKVIIKQPYEVYKTSEFLKWFNNQTIKSQAQINERIDNIVTEGHFGDYKDLDDIVSELKWRNGRRVYYAYLSKLNILLLLGGNKNGQDKDIRQARKIFAQQTKPNI